MNFTEPTNAQAPKRRGRLLPRLLWGLTALLLVLLGSLLALPTVLSTAPVRRFALQQLSAALGPGASVACNDWALSWWRPQHFTGLHVSLPAQGIEAEIAEVRLSSLWALLPLKQSTLEAEVLSPTLRLTAATPPDTSATAALPSTEGPRTPVPQTPASQTPASPTEASPTEASPKQPLTLPELEVHLRVRDLKVYREEVLLLETGSLELTMPTIREAIRLSAEAKTLLEGAVTLEATFPSAEALLAAQQPGEMIQSATLQLTALGVTVQSEVIGIIDASSTNAGLTDAGKPEAGLTDAGQTDASSVSDAGKGAYPAVRVEGRVNLVEALPLAPALGVSTEGLEVRSGELIFSAALAPRDALVEATATLSGKDMACAYQGKAIAFEPALSLRATVDPLAPLETLAGEAAVSLPGMTLQASGNLAWQQLQLRGTVASAPLLEALAPLLNGFTLPQPLTLSFAADAQGTQHLTAEASLATARKPIFALKGGTQRQADGSVTFALEQGPIAIDVEELLTVFPLPEGMRFSSKALMDVAAQLSEERIAVQGAFALQNSVFASTAWKVREAALLKATLSALYRKADGSVTLEAEVQTPPATLAVKGPLETLTLKGTLLPGKALAWRVAGKDETLPEVTGSLALEGTVTALKQVALSLTSEDLAVQVPPEKEAIALPLTLQVTAAQGDKGITLKQAALTTPYLALEAQGSYQEDHVVLEGTLTPDFAALWTLPQVKPYREAGFSISGKHSEPFRFEAPVSEGLPGILNYGTASAGVTFDRIVVPGLDIPNAKAQATLGFATASLDCTATVNDGQVTLRPQVALATKPYVLTFPEQAPLLKEVALTEAMLDEGLKFVNPLLSGAVSPSGTVSLTAEAFRMELSEKPLESLTATLLLETKECAIAPNASLTQVLQLLHETDGRAELPDQALHIHMEQGVLTTDPLTMRVRDFRLSCEGQTNLATKAIDYRLSVPLSAELLGTRGAKYLKAGKTLTLPIGGTVDRPRVDTSALMEVFTETAKEAASTAAQHQLNKQLEKLQQKKNSGKKSDQRKAEAAEMLQDLLIDSQESGTGAEDSLNKALQGLFNKLGK